MFIFFRFILFLSFYFTLGMSEPAKDILSKLLVRDPKNRLGSGDADAKELKDHAFFAEVDWVNLEAGNTPAPWTPAVVGSLDTSQFDQVCHFIFVFSSFLLSSLFLSLSLSRSIFLYI